MLANCTRLRRESRGVLSGSLKLQASYIHGDYDLYDSITTAETSLGCTGGEIEGPHPYSSNSGG